MQASLKALGIASVAAVSFVASDASASVITFTQQFVWEAYVSAQGNTTLLEDFNDIADGFYASPFSQSVGSVTWNATASGGLYVSGGQFSTNFAEPLTFSFGPEVRGIGGNFYGTDISFNVVPTIVTISLSDGTSYVGLVGNSATFTGFYSSSAYITAVTVSTAPGSGGGAVFPTVDNVQFAVVPAPGALALLGLAGVAGLRRRR